VRVLSVWKREDHAHQKVRQTPMARDMKKALAELEEKM
jgi:hypothetical protein